MKTIKAQAPSIHSSMKKSSAISIPILITLMLAHIASCQDDPGEMPEVSPAGPGGGGSEQTGNWEGDIIMGLRRGDKNSSEECGNLTMDSPWEDQVKIHTCHYHSHTHPRQVPRKRRNETEAQEFHHLAIFNIRYDMDFAESGEACSVQLQDEWLNGAEGPRDLEELSYNRIWYKRMCNFFSFLECIPTNQTRTKSKSALEALKKTNEDVTKPSVHADHTHAGAQEDGHGHPIPDQSYYDQDDLRRSKEVDKEIEKLKHKPQVAQGTPYRPLLNYTYTDPTGPRETDGLVRLAIGGRGPGKMRQRSGPGGKRVDAKKMGHQVPLDEDAYPLDGICICSTYDPLYPDRKRPQYGIDFVEDESRPKWCVSAPGNLCGRVYFKPNLWPGPNFEMSDHIGCAKMYRDKEYECVRWQLKANRGEDEHFQEGPNSMTSTCEEKKEETDEEKKKMIERAAESEEEAAHASSLSGSTHSLIYSLLISAVIRMSLL